jgi:hypothetical protein
LDIWERGGSESITIGHRPKLPDAGGESQAGLEGARIDGTAESGLPRMEARGNHAMK